MQTTQSLVWGNHLDLNQMTDKNIFPQIIIVFSTIMIITNNNNKGIMRDL